jgi:hypothetical protein
VGGHCRAGQGVSTVLAVVINNRKRARSPWYFASERLHSEAPMTVCPAESQTRHSHRDRPRLVRITWSIN